MLLLDVVRFFVDVDEQGVASSLPGVVVSVRGEAAVSRSLLRNVPMEWRRRPGRGTVRL